MDGYLQKEVELLFVDHIVILVCHQGYLIVFVSVVGVSEIT